MGLNFPSKVFPVQGFLFCRCGISLQPTFGILQAVKTFAPATFTGQTCGFQQAVILHVFSQFTGFFQTLAIPEIFLGQKVSVTDGTDAQSTELVGETLGGWDDVILIR